MREKKKMRNKGQKIAGKAERGKVGDQMKQRINSAVILYSSNEGQQSQWLFQIFCVLRPLGIL